MTDLPEGLTINRFDPLTATADEWRRLHVFRRARQAETRPDDPLYPDDLAEKDARAAWENPERARVSYHVHRDHRIVANMGASWQTPSSPSYESGKHIAYFGVHVLAPERRQGIATTLVRQLLTHTDPAVHKTLSSGTEQNDGHAFLRWLGFEERMKGAENRLDLEELDWTMVNSWVRDGEARSPQTRLQSIENRVPDEMLDAWCEIRTALFNIMPFDDLDHGEITVTPENMSRELYRWIDESGSTWHCLLAVASDGAIEGMTDVAYMPFEPDRIYQFLTGVRAGSQGRGLGKWLKAAMLLFLREQYPAARWVITENATSNAPMLAINDRLGFKEHMSGSTYQAELAKVAAFLETV